MTTIGQTLCDARERLGLTLEEAERATRIRAHHLQALESEAWDTLPSPVQARGFLHNYAEFLGLNPDALLLQYVDVLQHRRSALAAPTRPVARAAPVTAAVPVRRPRWVSPDLLISSVVVLAVMAVLVWGVGRMMAGFRARTLEEAGGVSLAIPTAELTPSPTPETPFSEVIAQPAAAPGGGPTATLAPPPILASFGRVNVQLVIERRAWLRVVVDGTEQYSGRAAAGDLLEYQAQRTIEVVTGNGGGVRAFFQGEDTGLMGEFGEAVIRIWSEGGLITPTPTATPQITATQPVPATGTQTTGG